MDWASVAEGEGVAVRSDGSNYDAVLEYLHKHGDPPYVLIVERLSMDVVPFFDRDPRCSGVISVEGGPGVSLARNAREVGIPVCVAGVVARRIATGATVRFAPPQIEVDGDPFP